MSQRTRYSLPVTLTAIFMASACGSEGRPSRGGGTQPDAGTSATEFKTCATAADCAWGEIDHELLRREDCVCLYGCPYLPLSQTTVARRAAAHTRLCDPRKDGAGDNCGIDDCSPPGALSCVEGTCRAAK